MKISIIALTYNHEHYIKDLLNSVQYQIKTYDPQRQHHVQLIVADDCSKDNTVKAVQSWVEKNGSVISELQIIENKSNIGTCHNYLNALQQCDGDYIKAIGGDDILPEISLFTLAHYLDQYDLIYGVPIIYYENDNNDVNSTMRILHKMDCINREEANHNFYDLIHRTCFINGPATYVSKKLLTDSRVIDFLSTYKYTDDYPQWLKMAEIKEISFAYIPVISAVYRRTEKSAYLVQNNELLKERINIHQYAFMTCKEYLGKKLLNSTLKNMYRLQQGLAPRREAIDFLYEYYWIKNKVSSSPYTKNLITQAFQYVEMIKSQSL